MGSLKRDAKARLLRIMRNYGRLFVQPHLKVTVITSVSVCALFMFLEATIVGVVLAVSLLWVRQSWITLDDEKEEASAEAERERARRKAPREREATDLRPRRTAFVDDILGVSENATDAEIRTAFRKLARRYHPDRGRYSHSANVEKFRQVQEAYAKIRRRRAFLRNSPERVG